MSSITINNNCKIQKTAIYGSTTPLRQYHWVYGYDAGNSAALLSFNAVNTTKTASTCNLLTTTASIFHTISFEVFDLLKYVLALYIVS